MDVFVNALDGYPIQFGLILIGLGIIFLLFQLDSKESFRMKNHGLFSWRALLAKWTIILMCFITGLILILKNIL